MPIEIDDALAIWSCSRESGSLQSWQPRDSIPRVTSSRCTLSSQGALVSLYTGRLLVALIESPNFQACSIVVIDTGSRARPEIVRFPAPELLLCAAVTPDSRLLFAGATSGRCYAWECTSGTLLRVWDAHIGAVRALSVLADASVLATSGDDALIHVWSLVGVCSLRTQKSTSGMRAHATPLRAWRTLDGHALPVRALCCGLPGAQATLLTGSDDGTLKCWRLSSGTAECTIVLHAPVTTVVFAEHAGIAFAGLADGKLARLNMSRTAERAGTTLFTGHAGRVTCARLSPAGKTLVTSSSDGTVRCWDVATLALLSTYDRHSSTSVDAVAVVPLFPEHSLVASPPPFAALQHTTAAANSGLPTSSFVPATAGSTLAHDIPTTAVQQSHTRTLTHWNGSGATSSLAMRAILHAMDVSAASERRPSNIGPRESVYIKPQEDDGASNTAFLQNRVQELERENAQLREAGADLYELTAAHLM